MYHLTCQQCGKEFDSKYPSKYCSRECVGMSQRKRDSSICPICGKEFYSKNSSQKYCSKECYTQSQTTLQNKFCKYCGKEFRPRGDDSKFCSRECYNKFLAENPDRYDIMDKVREENIKSWKSLTDEEKKERLAPMREGQKKFMNSLSEEERSRRLSNAAKSFWDNASKESKEVRSKRVSATRESLSKDERQKRGEKYSEALKKIWSSYSEEEKGERMSKLWEYPIKAKSGVNQKYKQELEQRGFDVIPEFRVKSKAYDFKIGDILLEINPYPYHNSTWAPRGETKSPTYHLDKLKLARDNGYRCIMVRDRDDFDKITYLLDNNKQVIYARDCEVREVSHKECHDFFEAYHLQGDTRAYKNNIYIGLYYEDTLVECMSFGKPRYNKNYEREILRLCSHKDYRVVGGANKIYRYFLDFTQANSVVSYCDMSKFDGRVYEQLGFKLLKWNRPSKHRYNEGETLSMKHITDSLLRQRGYDQLFNESHGKGTSNEELMLQRGYVEIYDCGQATFVRNK